MKIGIHPRVGHAVLCAALASATSCSGPSQRSPTAPSPTTLQSGQQTQIAAGTLTFPLLAGSFAIGNRDGDGIVGTYTGTAVYSEIGFQQSSLTFQISNGSGAFAGATGTMTVQGVGAFADEGQFALAGRGDVTLAGGKSAVLKLSLRGSSVATCSASEQIAISQTAEGTMVRGGRVQGRLTHEVGNTGCS